MVEDGEVIEAFLEGGARAAFGPTLHVEGDALQFDGWWAVAYRITGRTVLVRDEPTPSESTATADIGGALGSRGLVAVGTDLPGITVLTYTKLDLGYAPWVLWSTDLDTGEADLNAKATEDTSLQAIPTVGANTGSIDPALVRGARRTAGAPTCVVLTVGLSHDQTAPLRDGLLDCRLESRDFDDIGPDDCDSVLPTLILVAATEVVGKAFVVGLGARPGVHGPVVAVTDGGEMQAGADATVDTADPPARWVPLVQALLG
ncbi:hypothetical protein BH20ACT2_BH20ACT2_04820 [soil metagenome]